MISQLKGRGVEGIPIPPFLQLPQSIKLIN